MGGRDKTTKGLWRMRCTLGNVMKNGSWFRCSASVKNPGGALAWCDPHQETTGANYKSLGMLDLVDDLKAIMVTEAARVREEVRDEGLLSNWSIKEIEEQQYARAIVRMIEISNARVEIEREYETVMSRTRALRYLNDYTRRVLPHRPNARWRARRDQAAMKRAIDWAKTEVEKGSAL